MLETRIRGTGGSSASSTSGGGRSPFRGTLATAPTSAQDGDYYVSTVDNKIYFYYSFQWQETMQMQLNAPVTGSPMPWLFWYTYTI